MAAAILLLIRIIWASFQVYDAIDNYDEEFAILYLIEIGTYLQIIGFIIEDSFQKKAHRPAIAISLFFNNSVLAYFMYMEYVIQPSMTLFRTITEYLPFIALANALPLLVYVLLRKYKEKKAASREVSP